jgi:hypothetical protein
MTGAKGRIVADRSRERRESRLRWPAHPDH